jgi:hypothetical protein
MLMPDEFAARVVALPIEGRPEDEFGTPVKFAPGEVAAPMEYSGDEVLVISATRAATGEASAAWLPRRALLGERDFQPVTAWSGPTTLHRPQANSDGWAEYTIAADGQFTVSFHPGEAERRQAQNLHEEWVLAPGAGFDEPSGWSGRLYQNGNIIWFKQGDMKVPGFDILSLFTLDPAGNLAQVAVLL